MRETFKVGDLVSLTTDCFCFVFHSSELYWLKMNDICMILGAKDDLFSLKVLHKNCVYELYDANVKLLATLNDA